MYLRAGIILVLFLGASFVCGDRDLTKGVIPHDLASEEVIAKENVCTLCEEFATDVLDYLEDNSTRSEIIGILYQTCSDLPAITNQCTTLVDYYVPLIFTEILSVQPKLFCQYVDLCEEGAITIKKKSDEKCTVCQHIMEEVLTKLKDPDTEVKMLKSAMYLKEKNTWKWRNLLLASLELEIIELLLKACNAAEGHKNVQKCKRMVFKYGPLILERAPQVLQKLNLCSAIHACNSSFSGIHQKYLHSVS